VATCIEGDVLPEAGVLASFSDATLGILYWAYTIE